MAHWRRHHLTCLRRSRNVSENSSPSPTRPKSSRVRRSQWNRISVQSAKRMPNDVHEDVMPSDSHVTAMESIKYEFGLKASSTTTPGARLTARNVLRNGQCGNITAIALARHSPCTAEAEEGIIPRPRRRPTAVCRMLQHELIH